MFRGLFIGTCSRGFLQVADDGRGFVMREAVMQDVGGIGVIGLREVEVRAFRRRIPWTASTNFVSLAIDVSSVWYVSS